MMLNLDKWPSDSVAAIDAQGATLTYGALRQFVGEAAQLMPSRSLLFAVTLWYQAL